MRSRPFLLPKYFAYPGVENFAYPDAYPLPANYFHHKKIKIARTSTMTIVDDDGSVDSLDTPRPFADDAEEPLTADPSAGERTHSELMYVSQGRTLKALALLSLGLKNDDGSATFNPSVLPWSAALRPSALKLTAKELRGEVARRSVAAGNVLNAPRPTQWPVGKATEWLVANPIVAEDDVQFIRQTIAHRIQVAERAAITPAPSSNGGGGSSWIGKYPHLRLIHSIIDDNDIKRAYLARLNVPSGRMALENRNTPAARASNVWQMVANKWNDPLFLPVTSLKPDTHSDFSLPIALSYETVSKLQPATVEKVEEKWNTMILALKRGIQNWERSGQGDGGFTEEDEIGGNNEEEDNSDGDNDDDMEGNIDANDNFVQFGSLKQRPRRALDLRRNFFDGRATYLLYLWDMLEEHGLLQSSVQQLHDGIGSGDGDTGVPATVGGKRKSSLDDCSAMSSKTSAKSQSLVGSSIKQHGESIVFLAKTVAAEHEKNRREAREEQEKRRREDRAVQERMRVDSRINDIRARINSLRDNKRNMVLRMVEPAVANNKTVIDAILHEVQGIEEEITENVEELNSLLSTPKKNNQSPPAYS